MSIEQVATLMTIAIPIIGGLDYLIRWYFNSHTKALRMKLKAEEEKAEELQGEVKALAAKVRPDDWVSPHAAKIIDTLKTQVAAAQGQAGKVEKDLDQSKAQREALQAALANAQVQLGAAREKIAELSCQVENDREVIREYEKGTNSRNHIIKKALAMEGAIWTQKVHAGAPAFVNLEERRTPIVSMLNLKGGVGKTTLTAYVAWAMARRGYRVLLVDLDLQGSLSSLFLPEVDLASRHKGGQLLRHFLAQVAAGPHTPLENFTAPIDCLGGKANLIATTDKLAYEELNLTFQWLFRIAKPGQQWSGKRDVRLLLRKALHRKGLKKHYDLVMLDCPPIVNLSCINALAASDYVAVPVTPSRKALERVPPLLGRLKEIRQAINPDLNLLGLIANRTQWKESMTPTERDLWNALPQKCIDTFQQGVYRFNTFMPQRTLIRNAEDDFPPLDDEEMIALVDRLALEVESQLPEFCRPGKAQTEAKAVGTTQGENK